jgi:hypothetical protein
MAQQKHTLNTDLEALMEAQTVLDYHLEMGGNIEDLRKDITAEITEMAGMISLYHGNTYEMLNEHLPMMKMWLEALEQLNWFETVSGEQAAGVIGENYMRCAWGLELDLEQGDYNMSNDQMIVPFLNKLVKDTGPIDILDLRNFLGLYWGGHQIENIIVAFMSDRTPEPDDVEANWDLGFEPMLEEPELEIDTSDDEEEILEVEMAVYHLEVNEVVLREIHNAAAHKVIKAVELLDACTDIEDERLIRRDMYVNIKIKLECENLVPELAGEFDDSQLQ